MPKMKKSYESSLIQTLRLMQVQAIDLNIANLRVSWSFFFLINGNTNANADANKHNRLARMGERAYIVMRYNRKCGRQWVWRARPNGREDVRAC